MGAWKVWQLSASAAVPKRDLPYHDPKPDRSVAFIASNETAVDGSQWWCMPYRLFASSSARITARFFLGVGYSIPMSLKNPMGQSAQTAPSRQPRRTACSGPLPKKATPDTWTLAPAANAQLKSDPFADPAWRESSNLGISAASLTGPSVLAHLGL